MGKLTFFLLGLSSYCVKFAAKTEEDLDIEFFCVSVERKTKNHNRRLIPSFSIKKNIRNKIFLPSYLTIPSSPVRYIEKIYISLSILSMFFLIEKLGISLRL